MAAVIDRDSTIDTVNVAVYEVPTDQLEADGTLAWSSTTMVTVDVSGGGQTGIGWTYAGAGSAAVITDILADVCVGAGVFEVAKMTAADNLCDRLIEWGVTWEQRAMEGDPRFDASQSIPALSYAAWAELIGLKGIKVTRSDQLEEAFAQAFTADRPVIVDVMTSPDVPPMPPHVTFDQARALTSSVLADPGGGMAGAKEGIRQMVHEVLHHEKS